MQGCSSSRLVGPSVWRLLRLGILIQVPIVDSVVGNVMVPIHKYGKQVIPWQNTQHSLSLPAITPSRRNKMLGTTKVKKS